MNAAAAAEKSIVVSVPSFVERIKTAISKKVTIKSSKEMMATLSDAISILTETLEINITNDAEHGKAVLEARRIAGINATLEKQRKEITTPLDDKKSEIKQGYDDVKAKLANISEKIVKEVRRYENEKAEKARKEQAILDEAARIEREKAEKKAQKLEEQGKTEKADVLREEAASKVVVQIQTAPPKASGFYSRKTYSGECVSIKALCQSVIDGVAPESIFSTNQSIMNQLADQWKEELPTRVRGLALKVSEKDILRKA